MFCFISYTNHTKDTYYVGTSAYQGLSEVTHGKLRMTYVLQDSRGCP
jgi:hypothetical protein